MPIPHDFMISVRKYKQDGKGRIHRQKQTPAKVSWASMLQCVLKGTPHKNGLVQPYDFPNNADDWTALFEKLDGPSLNMLNADLFAVRSSTHTLIDPWNTNTYVNP